MGLVSHSVSQNLHSNLLICDIMGRETFGTVRGCFLLLDNVLLCKVAHVIQWRSLSFGKR